MNRSCLFSGTLSLALYSSLCLVGCAEDLNRSPHTLDSGDGDLDQWVPTGQAMQALTPRAAGLLGAQCTLMRFDWFYLEEDLTPLAQAELDQLKASVTERLGVMECGKQRMIYSLLATSPTRDRAELLARADAWSLAQEGHYLRPETLMRFEPAARRPAVEVAETCPDFEAYLGVRKAPPAIPVTQWRAILLALRDFSARSPNPGDAAAICKQVFSTVGTMPFPTGHPQPFPRTAGAGSHP